MTFQWGQNVLISVKIVFDLRVTYVKHKSFPTFSQQSMHCLLRNYNELTYQFWRFFMKIALFTIGITFKCGCGFLWRV